MTATTFNFNYSEYLSACRKLFTAPPTFKHLFGVRFITDHSTTQTSGINTMGWDVSYFAQGATTPELTLSTITRTFQGIEMRMPGLSGFAEKTLSLTFFDTQDRFIYNDIRQWQNTIIETRFNEDTVGQIDLTQIAESDRIIIQALSTDGANAPSWTLFGAFPMKITDTTGLNQEELTDVKTFTVDFKYRFASFGNVAQVSGTFTS